MPPTGGSATVCNSYLPSDSVFNRFIYVVQFLARNGIYVLLDNQINFDTTAATDTTAWLQVKRRCGVWTTYLNKALHRACKRITAIMSNISTYLR